MVQILERKPDLFAQTLGTGIGQVLQHLAQSKLQEIQQKQQVSGIRAVAPNLTEQQAMSLTSLPPQALGQILKAQINQPYEQKVAAAFAGEEPQSSATQPLPSQLMDAEISNALQAPSANLSQNQQPGSMQPTAQPKPVNKYAGLKAKDIAILRKLEQGEQKVAIQKEGSARKYIEPYTKAAEKSASMNQRYNNIIKAAQSGKLRAGTLQAGLEKMGLGSFWRNPTTEGAQTDINALALGVGSAYGPGLGRILAKEFEAYKDSLIRVWNTPQGMIAISRNELLKNDLILAKQEARRNLIKQNKGIVPFDIESQVDEQVTPLAKEISRKMDLNMQEALSEKMPKWGDKSLNPALYKEGTQAELEEGGRTYKITNGVWEPIY